MNSYLKKILPIQSGYSTRYLLSAAGKQQWISQHGALQLQTVKSRLFIQPVRRAGSSSPCPAGRLHIQECLDGTVSSSRVFAWQLLLTAWSPSCISTFLPVTPLASAEEGIKGRHSPPFSSQFTGSALPLPRWTIWNLYVKHALLRTSRLHWGQCCFQSEAFTVFVYGKQHPQLMMQLPWKYSNSV